MKAITYESFGGPERLRYGDMEKPVPAAGEVLVRIRSASVNPLDWHMLRGRPRLIRLSADLRGPGPMRPGRDLAGTVEAVGPGVTALSVGDEVFGAAQGAFADYVCAPETSFVAKPPAVSFDDAAATPIAGLTALQALRDSGRLRPGGKLLINGASGGVGTFAVQLAKAMGAEVTGVCSSASAPLVAALGADRIVDYRSEDFTAADGRYDLVLDLIGNHAFRRLKRILSPHGRVAAVGGGGGGAYRLGRWIVRTIAAASASRFTRRKVVMAMSRLDRDDLAFLGGEIAGGRLRPVIDRRYPLAETAEAMRYLGAGHAHGKVLIAV